MVFDPYSDLLGIPPGPRPPSPEQLLGVQPGERDEQAVYAAAARQKERLNAYVLGALAEEAMRLMNEVGRATVELTNRAAATTPALSPSAAAPLGDFLPDEHVVIRGLTTSRDGTAYRNSVRRLLLLFGLPFVGISIIVVILTLRDFGRTERVSRPSRLSEIGGADKVQAKKASGEMSKSEASPAASHLEDSRPVPAVYARSREKEPPSTKPLPPPPSSPVKQEAPSLAIAPFSGEEAREHRERWAAYLKARPEDINSIGIRLVLIPPGEFLMGSPDSDPDAQTGELPQHRVRITEAFYLGAHEVTVGQFKRFARETGYETEEEKGKRRSTWRLAIAGQTDNHPVVAVTWNDAKAFCKWLSRKEGRTYRLPTEAEWEYACRAGTTTRWSFGDNGGELGDYAWYDANTNRRRPYPVGQKKPNAWGLHDMHGNVEEWCADWDGLDYYISSPLDDPTGPAAGTRRVARGGSFYFGSLDTRSAWRDRTRPDNCGVNGGFRVTRVISPSPAPR